MNIVIIRVNGIDILIIILENTNVVHAKKEKISILDVTRE